MDLDSAISKHSEWKVKLRSAISKQEAMDAISIAKDNCCELGQWLHGEAKAKFGKLSSYSECVTKHAAFHVEAGKIASTINAKHFAKAETMLSPGSVYNTVSNTVATAIMRLKKEASL